MQNKNEKIIINTITLNNKKYTYSLKENKDSSIFFECKAANISQDFLAEDIAKLIMDLPELILSEKAHSKKASEIIQFRVTPEDKKRIEKQALKAGFDSISSYLRSNLASV